jgi:hypothetical protein
MHHPSQAPKPPQLNASLCRVRTAPSESESTFRRSSTAGAVSAAPGVRYAATCSFDETGGFATAIGSVRFFAE